MEVFTLGRCIFSKNRFFRLFKSVHNKEVFTIERCSLVEVSLYLYFNETMKCIGYQAVDTRNETLVLSNDFKRDYLLDVCFCKDTPQSSQSSENCWNTMKQSFLCPMSHQCMSEYRIENVSLHCLNGEAEERLPECQIK
jgi:hypothetical protein